MNLKELREKAKGKMGACLSCPVCDGIACKNIIPGPGAKGSGLVAIQNYNAWKKVKLEMDNLVAASSVDTSFEFFGKKFVLPVFAGPVGAVDTHYSNLFNDITYNEALVKSCKNSGICAFTGDGVNNIIMEEACKNIAKNDGIGIPTIKPWDKENLLNKLKMAKASNAFAIATDIDASGLPFLKNATPPAGSKSVEEMKEIISAIDVPYIIKGVMNIKTAKKAIDAGAKAIVVSNHGGRVLDCVPSTCEVLPEIKKFVNNKCKILVDGGIRNGLDVFKALALGADAVLIARPFVNCIYADKINGVQIYVDELKNELEDAMLMCGARKLEDINIDMVRY